MLFKRLKRGYELGVHEGYFHGRDQGYDDGYVAGVLFKRLRQRAYELGVRDGFARGHDQGYDDGYVAGIQEALRLLRDGMEEMRDAQASYDGRGGGAGAVERARRNGPGGRKGA